MDTSTHDNNDMKMKIEISLDPDVLRVLINTAAKEGRDIEHVLRDALLSYFRSNDLKQHARLEAVHRLCSKPFRVEGKALRRIVESDYFNQ
jgi:hypothetical protein